MKTPEQRFWSKVTKTETCWFWNGAIQSKIRPYGWLTRKNKQYLAHRMSWLITYGDIPEGINVLHKCDNPSCVRPSHLFLGTQEDNVHDMIKKKRYSKGTEHWNSIFTEEMVREIRKLHKEGIGGAELSRRFSCTHSAITKILKGRTWSHVE